MAPHSNFTITLLDRFDDGNWLVRITNERGQVRRFVAHESILRSQRPLAFKNLCHEYGDYRWCDTLARLRDHLRVLRDAYRVQTQPEAKTATRPAPKPEPLPAMHRPSVTEIIQFLQTA